MCLCLWWETWPYFVARLTSSLQKLSCFRKWDFRHELPCLACLRFKSRVMVSLGTPVRNQARFPSPSHSTHSSPDSDSRLSKDSRQAPEGQGLTSQCAVSCLSQVCALLSQLHPAPFLLLSLSHHSLGTTCSLLIADCCS